MSSDVRRIAVEHLGTVDAIVVVDLCRYWNYAEARVDVR
jgi:hypothetical protein